MRRLAVIALFTVGLGGCGSKSTTAGPGPGGGAGGVSGTGGSGGAAGATSSGGTAATGGSSGSGGTSAAGGASGTGGASSTGGAAGGTADSGGMTTSGGKISSGGTTGAGGSGGSAGGVTGTGGASRAGGATGSGGTSATGGSLGQPDAAWDVAKDVAREVSPPLDAVDAPPAQCPSTSSLKAGDSQATLQFGGRSRSYGVYVPSSIKAGTAVPLIFDFHGNGSSGAQEESSSGWKKKADQVGFIMVYPDGVGKGWNVGNCCGEAMSSNVDDVGFTRAMIKAISQAACIDAKRIYATGMSNGAGLVHRLGCEAADVLAAIAAASADLVTDPCTPARPIAELSVRGLSDTMVAYDGGNTGSTGWYSPGAKKTLELWKTIDQCTGSPQTTHQYCETYSTCAAGVEATLCSLPNTGHDTYNNAVGLSVPDVAWEMFQRQTLP